MGADAMDNIYYTKYLIDNKYDGIIHIKSLLYFFKVSISLVSISVSISYF